MEADLSEHTKLTELVSLGAVKRLQDSEDGRVVRLYITEKDKRCFRMRKNRDGIIRTNFSSFNRRRTPFLLHANKK